MIGLFSVGQNVAYGIHGVCKIVNIETRKVDKKHIEYFVLEPIRQPGSFYYIPTQNPNALAKLRTLITADQVNDALNADLYNWIDDENQRKQNYRELITSAGCSQLISVVRVLRKHKRQQMELGKKFHLCDENFLRDAERLISEELSAALDMPIEAIPEYLNQLFQ